jgi:FAD/FMN-containing dehydrogenase
MSALITALRAILPQSAIITDAADRAVFETDWRRLHSHPCLCAILPETTAQVAAIIRLCAEHGVGVVPQGGNTGLVAGGVPVEDRPQIVLNLRRMNRILGLDMVGNTITAQAGVVLQTLQDAAAQAGRLFPVSLGAEGSAQIGGVISTNAGGIQVLAYGSMRAQVLGLEVVLPDGQVWDGMRALVKDNTGFDLKQIFIGGEGTLGIITAAVLRLHPAVAARATALVGVADVDAALQVFGALRAAAGPALTMCEFMTQAAFQLGVDHKPGARAPFAAAGYLLVELSAPAGEVATLLEATLAEALEQGIATDAVIAQSDRERLDFLALRDAVPEGELAEGGAVKHDICVPITTLTEAVAAIEALLTQHYPDCRLNLFGHVGDGNLHVNIRPGPGQRLSDLQDRKAAITLAVETIAVRLGGSFSAEHGIGQMRIAGMAAHKSAVELAMMGRLKAAFDPANTLNPGKMLP